MVCQPRGAQVIARERVCPAYGQRGKRVWRRPVFATAATALHAAVEYLRPGGGNAPLLYKQRDAHGELLFRAYWLDVNSGSDTLLAIIVWREDSWSLTLLHIIEQLPLSHRQAQVCLLLMMGYPNATIGEYLRISKHTAISHCRQVYNKLGVHSRGELTRKVLALQRQG